MFHWSLVLVMMTSWLRLGEGVVSCNKACSECELRALHPDLVEVYCAMCGECRQQQPWTKGHRHDYRTGQQPWTWATRRSLDNGWQKYDNFLVKKLRGNEGEEPDPNVAGDDTQTPCPTSPPCSEEETTCPPITDCIPNKTTLKYKPKPKPRPTQASTVTAHPQHILYPLVYPLPCMLPCAPMCPYPGNPCCNTPASQVTTQEPQPQTRTTAKDHILYIGIPKEIDKSS